MISRLWSWLMFAASLTCWPVDLIWRGLLRQEVAPNRSIRYRDLAGRSLTVPAWYRCDHSTFSPNLFRLDLAGAAAAAILAWTVAFVACATAWSCAWSAPWWAAWLAWAWACGLALPFSDGQYIHDYAYDVAQWDDGSRMTKGAADGAMILRLADEGHPRAVLSIYLWGITTGVARWVWNRHDDGRPRA
jgi:hypothetical protein